MKVDIAVVGSGPAGLLAAIAAADLGWRVALVGPRPALSAASDTLAGFTRTAAVFPPGMAVVERALGGRLAEFMASTQRLGAIRMVDGLDGILRAPEVTFRAEEIGLERLATNVPIGHLTRALAVAVETRVINWHDARATAVTIDGDGPAITLDGGATLEARLIVAADGHDSLARTAAGISPETWSWDQLAIVTAFEHRAPHRDVSTEIHRPGGPCTTVPLPQAANGLFRSSLVWLESRSIATRMLALDDHAFVGQLERHVGGHTGAIERVGPRAGIEMRGLGVREVARRRVVLIGETAHVFPPIGAQGLNMTIRDVVALGEAIGAPGHDPGHDRVLEAYARSRADDMRLRTLGVSAMNSALLDAVPGFGLARGAALHALARVPALKRQVMRAGMGGGSSVRPSWV